MVVYKLKFNSNLKESIEKFKNLRAGQIVSYPSQVLWHRDGSGFHAADTHVRDLFVVIEVRSDIALLITEEDFKKAVKFLHLRSLKHNEKDDDRDFFISQEEAPDDLTEDSNLECDCVYYLNPSIDFKVGGGLENKLDILPEIANFVNGLIEGKRVYNNLNTNKDKEELETNVIKPTNESLSNPYRYTDNGSGFICIINNDYGLKINGSIKLLNEPLTFNYDYNISRILFRSSGYGDTVVFLNPDDSYTLDYDDNNFDDQFLDILVNCFIDMLIDYDNYNFENNKFDW